MTKKAALVAIANKEYLPGLHVMLHSARRLGLLDKFDFLLITTDRALRKDPLVEESCASVIVIDDKELEVLRQIPDTGVKEHLRLPNIAKYNFIKFYAFRDLGYEFNVLVDVDMIMLKSFDVDDVCFPGVDIAASPRFDAELYRDDKGSEAAQDEVDANLERFWSSFEDDTPRVRINSGFTVIGKGIQSDATYTELIRLAADLEAGGDQGVIWRFIQQGGVNFRALSPSFNFNQHALTHLSVFKQIEWLNRAHVLHYPGSYPWDSAMQTRLMRNSHNIWHHAYVEAKKRIKSLRGRAQEES